MHSSFEVPHLQIPADIYELDSELIVEIDLPGISPGEVEFMLDGTLLCVRTRRPESLASPVRTYHRRQRGESRFFGYVDLPTRVDPMDAVATLHDGVLTIRLQIHKDPEHAFSQASVPETGSGNLGGAS